MSAVSMSAAEPIVLKPSIMPAIDLSPAFFAASACACASFLATCAMSFSCSRTLRYIFICASVSFPSAGGSYLSFETSFIRSIVPCLSRSWEIFALSNASFALQPARAIDSMSTAERVRRILFLQIRCSAIVKGAIVCGKSGIEAAAQPSGEIAQVAKELLDLNAMLVAYGIELRLQRRHLLFEDGHPIVAGRFVQDRDGGDHRFRIQLFD